MRPAIRMREPFLVVVGIAVAFVLVLGGIAFALRVAPLL